MEGSYSTPQPGAKITHEHAFSESPGSSERGSPVKTRIINLSGGSASDTPTDEDIDIEGIDGPPKPNASPEVKPTVNVLDEPSSLISATSVPDSSDASINVSKSKSTNESDAVIVKTENETPTPTGQSQSIAEESSSKKDSDAVDLQNANKNKKDKSEERLKMQSVNFDFVMIIV